MSTLDKRPTIEELQTAIDYVRAQNAKGTGEWIKMVNELRADNERLRGLIAGARFYIHYYLLFQGPVWLDGVETCSCGKVIPKGATRRDLPELHTADCMWLLGCQWDDEAKRAAGIAEKGGK